MYQLKEDSSSNYSIWPNYTLDSTAIFVWQKKKMKVIIINISARVCTLMCENLIMIHLHDL